MSHCFQVAAREKNNAYTGSPSHKNKKEGKTMNRKRTIALLLCISIMVGLVPMHAVATAQIEEGLAMGLLTVNRSDFRFPFRTPRDPDPWNDVTLSPRSYEQIQYMAKLFDDKVWHERHKAMRYRIEHGQEQCNPEVWARALEAAKEIEEKYGRHNLGPYTDFEWGMLTGKMVALRWVMGCQWDDLDT